MQNVIPQSVEVTQQYQPLQLRDTDGDNLWIAGYRCYVRDECSFYVRKPDGTKYIVNPYQQTCTCRASCRCKHLEGLCDLVFLSAASLEWAGKYEEAGRLYDVWSDF